MRKFLYWEIDIRDAKHGKSFFEDMIDQKLATADFSKLTRLIKDEARNVKNTWNNYKKDPVEARFRRGGFMTCLWVLCMYLYYYDHDTPANVQEVKGYAETWGIDESIMLEMKDIAQAYKLLEPYARDDFGYGTECVRPEAADDKRDLDESVRALIELG